MELGLKVVPLEVILPLCYHCLLLATATCPCKPCCATSTGAVYCLSFVFWFIQRHFARYIFLI